MQSILYGSYICSLDREESLIERAWQFKKIFFTTINLQWTANAYYYIA